MLYGSSAGVRCMAVSCTTPTSGGVCCTTKLYYIGGVRCMAVVVEYVVWL